MASTNKAVSGPFSLTRAERVRLLNGYISGYGPSWTDAEMQSIDEDTWVEVRREALILMPRVAMLGWTSRVFRRAHPGLRRVIAANEAVIDADNLIVALFLHCFLYPL